MSDALLEVVERGIRLYDLGRPMFQGMPQSPNHPGFVRTLPRRHGDVVRADGGSSANDLLITGTHVGTHIDALAHVSQDGLLHGDADVTEALTEGRYLRHGVHTIAPMMRRGVLLDIPAAMGIDCCSPAFEVTSANLAAACDAQKVTPRPGDIALVRTGWGKRFDEGASAYLGNESGVPGVGEDGAHWLAAQGVVAAGTDTIAFDRLAPGSAHSLLPAHRILLVDHGIYIIEALALEEIAATAIYEFTLILVPLNLIGATGSPVRPLAVCPRPDSTRGDNLLNPMEGLPYADR